MGLFSRFRRKKDPNSPEYRWEKALEICGQHIKYVTEKKNDVEEVIGRAGGLNIREDEFIVFSSSDVVFRCKIEQLQIWELLSHDGVVLTGPDIEHGGVERTVIAHYVYYRK